MSAFWLYVILKMDRAVALFGFLGAFLLILSVVLVFLAISARDFPYPGEKEFTKAMNECRKSALATALAGFLCIAASCAMPNTKQMAALLVLPRILTEENVGAAEKEMGEVYGLAKEWFRDKVKQDEDDQ